MNSVLRPEGFPPSPVPFSMEGMPDTEPIEPTDLRAAAHPDLGGLFSWKGLVLASSAGAVAGCLLAWAAHVVQGYFAPLVLFPLVLGAFCGLAVVAAVRIAQIGHRPTILAAALLAGATAAVGQHYAAYYAHYLHGPTTAGGASAISPADWQTIARNLAPSFGDYPQQQARRGRHFWFGWTIHGWVVWLSWAVDAMIVAAAAAAVVLPALRVPYCNRCRSWYRTTRGGRIDEITARRLAQAADVQEINHPRSHRYRLSNCQGGCGPTRLELSWEEADGAVDLARVWLDKDARTRVAAILDGLVNEK